LLRRAGVLFREGAEPVGVDPFVARVGERRLILLIQLGRLDHRELLARRHVVALVDQDLPQVAAHFGVQRDGRVGPRLAQEREGLHTLRRRHARHAHVGPRRHVGGARPPLRAHQTHPAGEQPGDDGDRRHHRHHAPDEEPASGPGPTQFGHHVSPLSSARNRSSSKWLVGGSVRINEYTTGTTNSVAAVASTSPPITARPSGAFCSPPSPSPTAIGTMPMIIASAVISTGRSRVLPASSAEARASPPVSTRRSLAKLTSRIELDTAMPTAMIEPISDSTFSVVPVSASIQRMPTRAPGTAAMMMNG